MNRRERRGAGHWAKGAMASKRADEESGIEELRRLVSNAGYARESAFDGLTLEQVVKVLRACDAIDLETFADQLTPAERRYAARRGKVSTSCLRRLYREEGLPEEGVDWEGRR